MSGSKKMKAMLKHHEVVILSDWIRTQKQNVPHKTIDQLLLMLKSDTNIIVSEPVLRKYLKREDVRPKNRPKKIRSYQKQQFVNKPLFSPVYEEINPILLKRLNRVEAGLVYLANELGVELPEHDELLFCGKALLKQFHASNGKM